MSNLSAVSNSFSNTPGASPAATTCTIGAGSSISEPVVAVAFAPNGWLLMQTREPSQLLVIKDLPGGTPTVVALSQDSRLDTGHDIFHRDSGAGIACASCHPEGGEDGHVWRFTDVGERRTQALHVGLDGTAPFHWDGAIPDVAGFMTQVFVGRMGGVNESQERLDVLTHWLFGIKPPPAIRSASDDAVQRGQALFASASTGCSSCHAGQHFTDNRTVNVGTQSPVGLQVPSLVGVGYRAPFLHNGCAATLTQRFDPACGGTAHGNTAQLSSAEIGDLVAFLESI